MALLLAKNVFILPQVYSKNLNHQNVFFEITNRILAVNKQSICDRSVVLTAVPQCDQWVSLTDSERKLLQTLPPCVIKTGNNHEAATR